MNEIPKLRMSIKLGRARKAKREVGKEKGECKMKFVSLPSRVFEQFAPLY